jgi:hypothetical protein
VDSGSPWGEGACTAHPPINRKAKAKLNFQAVEYFTIRRLATCVFI